MSAMRCELNQMERMDVYERFGTDAGDAMRRAEEIRRRMRSEKKKNEEEREDEYLGD